MKNIYVKVDGMTCEHCRNKVKASLQNIENVKKVIMHKNIANIFYSNTIDYNEVINTINKIGYFTNEKMITSKEKNISIFEILIISITMILLVFLINNIFGFNIFNIIPKIDNNITYLMLFTTGLLTSIHCISMCGGINLIATNSIKKDFKKPLLYNLGRLISYTTIGGLVGLIGSTFSINNTLKGIVIILASITMFLMALNMSGLIRFSIKYKSHKERHNALIIGLLNGLMPCGPLQAMQIYALSTGSFIVGAISMFIFCLGTIPLMLLMGIISNFFNSNTRRILNKISIVLIMLLSIVMFNRGISSFNIDLSKPFKQNYDNYLKSQASENYQTVKFDLAYSGYKDIVVLKGIPVKIIINASKNKLTGCNETVDIRSFNITKELEVGENIIEFIPEKTGTYIYTCSMGMLKNRIVVVDNISLFNQNQ